MVIPHFLQFIISVAEEGGYFARAVVGHAIFTQGDTLDENMKNIREATACHFEDGAQRSSYVLPIIANFEVPQFA